MVLLRYPGTKTALEPRIPHERYECWCEPFLGAGGMALAMAKRHWRDSKVERFLLGDADMALVALWHCVLRGDSEFNQMVREFKPSLDEWEQQRQVLRESVRDIDLGFAKLAVHQMSYSGLGEKAGGPIGGSGQKGKWDVACRWNSTALLEKFAEIRKLLGSRTQLVWKDWRQTLELAGDEATLYIDPPYCEVGDDLYVERVNHGELAAYLEREERCWWLSYDDCHRVRHLYAFAGSIREVDLSYTIAKKRTQRELLITS